MNQNIISKDSLLKCYSAFSAMAPDEKPFAHPSYWAGFIFNGV